MIWITPHHDKHALYINIDHIVVVQPTWLVGVVKNDPSTKIVTTHGEYSTEEKPEAVLDKIASARKYRGSFELAQLAPKGVPED